MPLPTTAGLAGTSMTITSNGATFPVPMLFTVASQVAGIIPSITPVGNATLSVTYNGRSGAVPITIVPSAFGISNVYNPGLNTNLGAIQTAIVSFGTNQTQVVTANNTAKPGDTLIIWGTGLGATTSAGDTAGAPYGNVGPQPQVFVGGVPSPSIAYWGRSPGSVGLDEIVFVVPQNAPLGCNVGIVVQTTSGTTQLVSNAPVIALAASDGATCSDSTQYIPASYLSRSSTKLFTLGVGQSVAISPNSNGTVTTTVSSGAKALFGQFTQAQLAATAASVNGEPSFGSCYTAFLSTSNNGGQISATPLSAGASVILIPPSGNALTLAGSGQYKSAAGSTVLPSGTWSFTDGAGGPDIGPLNFSFNVPQQITWSNQAVVSGSPVTRANPLTITWSGGDGNGFVDILGKAQNSDGQYNVGFECAAPTSAGQFTIPSSILLAMPTGPSAFASIQVSTAALPYTLGTIPGFDAAIETSQFSTLVPLVYK